MHSRLFLPELGRLIEPDESSIAPLLLRVIPIQPPIAMWATAKSFHEILMVVSARKQTHPFYTHRSRIMTNMIDKW